MGVFPPLLRSEAMLSSGRVCTRYVSYCTDVEGNLAFFEAYVAQVRRTALPSPPPTRTSARSDAQIRTDTQSTRKRGLEHGTMALITADCCPPQSHALSFAGEDNHVDGSRRRLVLAADACFVFGGDLFDKGDRCAGRDTAFPCAPAATSAKD